MFKFLPEKPQALVYSVLVHIGLVLALVVSFDWTAKPHVTSSPPRQVEAVVVDESQVQAALSRLKAAEEDRQQKERARIAEVERRLQETERKRRAEERQLAQLREERAQEEHKRKEEQRRLAAIETERKREEAAQQRETEARRKAEADKKRKENEARRQAEAEKKRKEDEARRQAEAEKKRKEDEAWRRRETELKAQIEAEERARRDAAAQREIDTYMALIDEKVTRNWLRPAQTAKGLSCTVRVRVIPGGEVVGAQIVASSGNAVFDRSAETAVRKSSPLPFPKNPALVERMREFDFVFRPER